MVASAEPGATYESHDIPKKAMSQLPYLSYLYIMFRLERKNRSLCVSQPLRRLPFSVSGARFWAAPAKRAMPE